MVAGKLIMIILPVFFFCGQIKAQNAYYDSLLNATLAQDSLFLEELLSDSLSFLDLLDSMVNLSEPKSYLSARMSYTSAIAYAGRNFGVSQYGFSAGLSYYHKSGLFADATGFWNSDITPKYNPTITSIGYMGFMGKRFTYMTSYDHYFYQENETDDLLASYPLTNALSLSGYYDIKFISVGTDYSFMFGDESAHRIRLNLIGRLKWHKKWIFDKISFSPGLSMLAGNQNIFTISQSYQFNREDFQKYLIDKYGYNDLYTLRQNRPRAFRLLVATEAAGFLYLYEEETSRNVFGIMNYSISAPVYFTVDKFTFALSYNLNFPVALPGEEVTYDPNSYFNASLLYNVFFK